MVETRSQRQRQLVLPRLSPLFLVLLISPQLIALQFILSLLLEYHTNCRSSRWSQFWSMIFLLLSQHEPRCLQFCNRTQGHRLVQVMDHLDHLTLSLLSQLPQVHRCKLEFRNQQTFLLKLAQLELRSKLEAHMVPLHSWHQLRL